MLKSKDFRINVAIFQSWNAFKLVIYSLTHFMADILTLPITHITPVLIASFGSSHGSRTHGFGGLHDQFHFGSFGNTHGFSDPFFHSAHPRWVNLWLGIHKLHKFFFIITHTGQYTINFSHLWFSFMVYPEPYERCQKILVVMLRNSPGASLFATQRKKFKLQFVGSSMTVC